MKETPYIRTFKSLSMVEGISNGNLSLYGFMAYNTMPTKEIQITGITTGVTTLVTVPCHNIKVHDLVYASDILGTLEMNNQTQVSVKSVPDANTVELNLDSSAYSAYISGGFLHVLYKENGCGDESFTCNDDSLNHVRNNILGMKRVTGGDVKLVIPRVDYSVSKKFDQYSSFYCAHDFIDPSSDCWKEVEQVTYNPIVITDENKVYLCLENNDGNPSNNKPTHITPFPETYADGYVWQYLYTVEGNCQKFLTPTHIPILNLQIPNGSAQWNTINSSSASTGKILNIEIVSKGAGYVDGAYPVNIVGNGINATAELIVVSGKVVSASITNRGEGYYYGNINPNFETSYTEPACFKVSSEPHFGIGLQQIFNTIAPDMMVVVDFEGDEGGKFMKSNVFCSHGLILNPLKFETRELALDTVLDARRKLTMATTPSTMQENEIISSSTTKSIVTEVKGATTGDVYILPEHPQEFVVGDLVSGDTSGSTNTIVSITDPDVEPGSGAIISYDVIADVIHRNPLQRERFRFIIKS